jgi:uncharacterized LabA/DUF88 family protein
MQSKCAVYVDAGYVLASAATRLTGTSLRSGVKVDHEKLIAALTEQAEEIAGLPLLRINWYDSARNAVPDVIQEQIGLLPRVKVRLGRVGFNGEQKGVDLRIGLDMVAHARNGAIDTIILVSGDDDLTEAVEEAQVHGVQVIILAVPNESGQPHGVSKHLQRASDGLDLLDPSAVDASVTRSIAGPPSSSTTPLLPPASRATPPTPTPATLANHVRPGPPAVAPPASTAPAAGRGLVYSATTGGPATIAPEFTRTPEEQMATIDEVVKRVLETWLRSASEAQRAELVDGRPSIPRDVDRALLLDLSDALDEYDLSEPVRIELRSRFWLVYDEVR